MGCNMCVVKRPEEQYRIMFQVRNLSPGGFMKIKLSFRLLQMLSFSFLPVLGFVMISSVSSIAMVAIPDCVDNATQTDISFQSTVTLGRSRGSSSPPPPPPSPPLPYEPYEINELYEVELYKSSQQEKLGLTVCYRTDDEEDLGIYVGEVNPNSIAAKNGRIREGDRILQINGVDIQNREEAVAILSREDSINFSLLLARPDTEVTSFHPARSDHHHKHDGERGEKDDKEPPVPLPPQLNLAPLLSNSQELDSGVGRTDDSTRYEDTSEHDLLGDQTSACNTNTTNTPGSTRKFRPGPRDTTPPFLHHRDLQLSCDSLPGMDWAAGGGTAGAEECQRNETLSEHELALIEEELRHLEFKCRNILRAQKMQQLRERCLKAWMMEEETVAAGLSAINELPERERSDDKDTTSAYNTGGESCRSTPLVSTEQIPPLQEDEDEGVRRLTSPPPLLPISRLPPLNSPLTPRHHRRDRDRERRHSNLSCGATNRPEGGSAESSPYFTRRQHSHSRPLERYQSCMALPSEGAPCSLDDHHAGASRLGLALPLGLTHSSPNASPQRMEWKVKIRSDGTRYVAKRPVRDRLLKARAMKIREERSGMTTDDDAASEMKQGRYWSKEERKQQLLRAREYRRRREFMMQSRLEYMRGDSSPHSNILQLSQKKITKRRNRRILDNWITIQELLAHGSRSPDGKKIYNPLLSVTTV
uniref:PDZ domain containing 4 n=1 Tax=Amphilophus citrinellus TaxID=61819 RepID=A0A3Q0R2T0_AMPCI